ncbi:hypothetical protein ABPG74_012681 [Tetrahymena malaccensis]
MATKKKLSPQEEIKSYSLKEGDYSITVKVLEANDLIPKGKGFLGFGATQVVTSQVMVEVLDKKKKSKIIKNQSNPVFNQGWTFYFKSLKMEQLQDITIRISVLDKSSHFVTHIIGSYEIDLTSVYFQLGHEYFHTWLTLTDPTDEVEGPTGYLYVNLSVLGPGDEPVLHDIENAKKAGSGKEKSLVPQKVVQTGHLIEINIYRAENLPCLDNSLDSIDAYVIAKFGGFMAQTHVVKSRNPEWNECIKLQCMLPCQSKQITIQVYDKDIGSDDDLVGQLKINLADIMYKKHLPKWGNLYGSPVTAQGKDADLMNFYGQTMGSHYRGRLLYSCSSYNKKDPRTSTKQLQFSFPHNPIPQTKMRSYYLWIDILEGNEIPDKQGDMIVHANIGPYLLYSQAKININGQVNWFESLEERKVIFPEDVEQIPDLIFYVTDQNSEDRRMSFNRIKASKILRTQQNFDPDEDHETILVELKEDRSLDLVKDDEFPGFLIVKASLLKYRPQKERKFFTTEHQRQLLADMNEYQLRVQLYQARGLPPADETGGCDPFIKVKCAGSVGTSKVKQKTLNPGWFQNINLDRVILPSMESLMKTKYPTKGMFLTVYDCDENRLVGQPKENLLTKIENFNFKKQINNLYSKIMNKPGDDGVDNMEIEDQKALINKSLVKTKINSTPEATPLDAQAGENLELNDSGIIVNDPDKIEKDLLGRIWIPLEATHVKFKIKNNQSPEDTPQLFDILYRRPKWYPVKYDANGQYTGQVLLSYTLIPNLYSDVIKQKPNLFPKFETKKISFFLIGVREIDEEILGMKLRKIQASLDVSGDSQEQFRTGEMKVVNSGGNINQYVEFTIKVPLNKSFDPVVDIFLWDCSRSEPYTFLGYGSLPFKDIPYLKYNKNQQENADLESEMSLVDCLKEVILLEKKMGSKIDQKDKRDQDEPKEERKVYKKKENPNDKAVNPNDNAENRIAQNDSKQIQEGLNAKLGSNQVNLDSQQVQKKDVQEEVDEIIDEPNVQQKNQLDQIYEEADIEITDVKEKQFDDNEINVIPAYQKENTQMQPLITNLPARPLDLQNMNKTNIIDIQDPTSIQKNEFITNPPNIQTLNTQLSQKDENDRLNQKQLQPQPTNGQQNINKDKLAPSKTIKDQKKIDHSQVSSNANEHHDNLEEHEGDRDQGQEGQVENKETPKPQKVKYVQKSEISTFDPPQSLSFSVKTKSKRSLHFDDIPKEGKYVGEEQEDENKGLVSGKILSLFKKKGGIKIIEYEDYDTDEDEDLDITPEWKKNREVFLSEFEDKYKPSRKLTCIPIMRGQSRGVKKDMFSFDKPEAPSQFAMLKCLFLDQNNVNFLKKVEELKKLLKERDYFIRIYVTRGKNIGGEGFSPDSYLKLKLGEKIVDLKSRTLQQDTNNPDYYISHDFECKLPGSAVLEVQIWNDVIGSDEMIGKTVIDMENRLFTGKWLQYQRKPFENRNIFPEDEAVSKGNLEMWVELIPKSVIKQMPPLPITKPPKYEFEIRVIVWETKDCVFKDEAEKCNDVYVRIGLQNKPDEYQDTDVHWRCRSNGFFNWRMKFRQSYPLNNDEYGGDKLFVQLLDKDIIASDDIIGSCTVDLNQHKLIDKCLKRQKAVQLQMRELNRKAKITDKIWYQVYNPLVRDKANKPIIQGQVCLSVEIMPVNVSEEKKNGLGRDSPNNFPPLDDPPGRMKFDILHPLEFIKTIVGPDLYKKCCGVFIFVFCFVICFGLGWVLISQVIANAVV